MDEFEKYLKIIKSDKALEDEELIHAADKLIVNVADHPRLEKILIEAIYELWENSIEVLKIRSIEIALKTLGTSFRSKNEDYANMIFNFLIEKIPTASEKVKSTVIIHYSWAHHKFKESPELVKIYDDLMTEWNKDKEFRLLFDEINHMGEVPSIH